MSTFASGLPGLDAYYGAQWADQQQLEASLAQEAAEQGISIQQAVVNYRRAQVLAEREVQVEMARREAAEQQRARAAQRLSVQQALAGQQAQADADDARFAAARDFWRAVARGETPARPKTTYGAGA
jgi:hypothetical protein